jgi:nucleoside-diphosphate-sugar epimerase
MMRIAITGGSGFIGTNLIEHYAALDMPVVNLDPAKPRNQQHVAYWRRIDPLDANDIKIILSEFAPTHVFHLGARTDLHGTTLEDYVHNTRGVEVILDACNGLTGLKRVVFASSRLVCRIGYQPEGDTDYCAPNAYGESKVRGEQLVRSANTTFPWVILRPTSIWGPWFDIPYRTFFLTIAANRYIHVGRRPVRKSFGYVGNTVQQLAAVAERSSGEIDGTTMYLADSPPIDVADMANRIQRAFGSRPIRTAPRSLVKPVALAGDLLQRFGWTEPPLTSFRLDNLLTEMIYNTAPLDRLLPQLHYSLDNGIQLTVDWMREQKLVGLQTPSPLNG